MSRFHECKNADAIRLIADMLGPISRIAENPENMKAKEGSTTQFLAAVLKNNADDVIQLLAINCGEDQSAVEWTVSDIWERALELFSDIAAAGLLGLKSSKAANDE